jgi:glycosyltransferase involved in cell wall biosynthesis
MDSMEKVFIGIPVLNRVDLLQRALESIDIPAYIYIVNNNSVDSEFQKEFTILKEAHGFDVYSARYNLGVAASWNRIIMHAMGLGYDKLIVSSNDTMMIPGSLAALSAVDIDNPKDVIWHLCVWNCWMLHVRAIPLVGWFDENFYPAYREDQDYSYRCDVLAKVNRYAVPKHPMDHLPFLDLPDVGADHLGSQTVSSDAEYAQRNQNTHMNWNTAHYRMKWGSMPGQETFTTPYDGKLDYRWWPDPGGSLAHRDWDNGRERVR